MSNVLNVLTLVVVALLFLILLFPSTTSDISSQLVDTNDLLSEQVVVSKESGEALVAGQDFYFNVASGNIAGYSSVNKFGHNTAATSGDDVWGGGGVYDFYPTTAQSMEILSTDVDDTALGTGARTVSVKGLNADWEEVSETVTLNGTTPVPLQNTYVRMYRAIVLSAGDSESNEGDLTVEIVGTDTVAIFIGSNDGQTQHAIYTVPSDKHAYFIKGYVGMADDDKNGEVAEFQWQVRLNNGVTGAWAVKGEVGLNNIGTSYWVYEYGVPTGPIPSKTDIRIKVISSTATLGVVGGFDLVLVDNEI